MSAIHCEWGRQAQWMGNSKKSICFQCRVRSVARGRTGAQLYRLPLPPSQLSRQSCLYLWKSNLQNIFLPPITLISPYSMSKYYCTNNLLCIRYIAWFMIMQISLNASMQQAVVRRSGLKGRPLFSSDVTIIKGKKIHNFYISTPNIFHYRSVLL